MANVTTAAFNRRFNDLPPAGVLPARKQDFGSTAACFENGGYVPPPAEIAKYRRTDREVGTRFLHPGLADDHAGGVDPKKTFGGSNKNADDDQWRTRRTTEVSEQLREAREKVYATVKREPLGRSYSRGFDLPPGQHVYGKSARPAGGNKEADQGGFAAKATVYPGPAEGETDEASYRDQYIISHHAYDVGQQKARGYSWPKEIERDMKGHAFGVGVGSQKAFNNNSESIKQQFAGPDSSGNSGRRLQPKVASQRVENFYGLRDEIGRCRNTAMGTKLPESHVFGATARRNGDWDARNCIEGEYGYDEQMPDEDLGSSVTPGFRRHADLIDNPNIARNPAQHAFGLPNIRSDLPMKHYKSIADNQNYGDDVTAYFLLYPPNSRALGVEAADFTSQRTKEDVMSLFAHVTAAAAGEGEEKSAEVPTYGPGALGNTLGAGRGEAASRLFASYDGPVDELMGDLLERAWDAALQRKKQQQQQQQQQQQPQQQQGGPPFPGAGETMSVVEFREAFNQILDMEEQRRA